MNNECGAQTDQVALKSTNCFSAKKSSPDLANWDQTDTYTMEISQKKGHIQKHTFYTQLHTHISQYSFLDKRFL